MKPFTKYSLIAVIILIVIVGLSVGLYFLITKNSANTSIQFNQPPTVSGRVASVSFQTSGKCIIPCNPFLEKFVVYETDQTTIVATVPNFASLQGPDSSNTWVGTVNIPDNVKFNRTYLGQATVVYGGRSLVGPQFPFIIELPAH